MNQSALSVAATMLILAAVHGDAIPADMTVRKFAELIPPNCTLDPYTGRMTCHIWPSCTMDPFTGKMTCPTPKARAATRLDG